MRVGGRGAGAAGLMAVGLVWMGACGRPDATTAPIVLWAMGREGEAVERLVPEFERRHPGLRVRVQQIPWSAAHEKLLTAYVGDALPDVVQVGSTWIPELAALGALAPLDARLDASPSLPRSDFFPGVLATHVIGGRTMAIPWYVDTRVLFYRSDRLRAAGVTHVPGTWDDWLAVMARLTAPSERYAIFLPVTDWVMPVVLALQRGAVLLRDDAQYGDFSSPPVRAAFQFYRDLFTRGLAPAAGAAEVSNVYLDFAAGYFTIYPSGPWDLGEFARRLPAALANDWAVAPMPGDTPGVPGVSLAGGAGLALVAGSPRPDQAWALIAFLSEPAQQVALHRLSGDLPARRSAWHAADLVRDPRAAVFWTQLAHVVAPPAVPEWERIATAVGRVGAAVIRGEVEVDAALAGLDRDVDGMLEKRRWLLARGAP
jgi:multiple sugar transport system substrate-binding protein